MLRGVSLFAAVLLGAASAAPLLDAYTDPMYQVKRASDSTTLDIKPLKAGGIADAAGRRAGQVGVAVVPGAGRGGHGPLHRRERDLPRAAARARGQELQLEHVPRRGGGARSQGDGPDAGARAVPRPHLRLQGHRAAVPGQPLRVLPAAQEQGAARGRTQAPDHGGGRHVRRHRQLGHLRPARQGERRGVHSLSRGPRERHPAAPDDHRAGREHPQRGRQGHVRRLPGHRQGPVRQRRLQGQIVYYVWAYFRAREHGVTGEIAFSVPTGNFGDILAGFYAKKLGVPIGKLIVATNENDILHRFFSTGKYHRRDIEHTISPSMDICVSSNFERYLFALSGENHDILRGWMQGFEQTNELTISGELLTKAQDEMASYAVLQDEVRSTIAEYKKVHRYLYDPHSAIGAAAAMHYGQDALTDKPNSAVVVVGTAHYGKFLPVVSKALGVAETEIQQHPILKSLESLPTRLAVANNSSATVAEHIRKTIAKKNQKACGDCFSLWSSAPTDVQAGHVCARRCDGRCRVLGGSPLEVNSVVDDSGAVVAAVRR
ncbi:hypothetical protein ON010_g12948 [Phytophthora cinnamomi]|nr:hypothetical protein ON010_g12948 [Phytophthora cinnamomi]